MLEDLIKVSKITTQDAELYQLFHISELGQKWLSRMMLETFLEQPPPDQVKADLTLFIDGRRSLLREIHFSLKQVEKAIKEFEYEYGAAARDEQQQQQ
jgi:hypothetical protein